MPWVNHRHLDESPSSNISSGNVLIQGLDIVILLKNRPNEDLVKGDVGSVVFIDEGGKAFEVEFTTLAGDPLGVLTLAEDEIRPVSARDVPHVRVT